MQFSMNAKACYPKCEIHLDIEKDRDQDGKYLKVPG